ncbi:MFS transporter [Caulobacter sp. 17J80-11]|nr:MFS transporter [Caulobacter sp. 17J80-11]
MYLMGADMGYRMAGMQMDAGMWTGMGLIALGVGLAGYGLLPRRSEPAVAGLAVTAPEDAPLTPAHWRLMAVLVIALVIDVMKPASLGFVVPGMIEEYGLTRAQVAWLPFAALSGTVAGSLVWGALADVFGRRATILLSAVMFVGSSVCGAMPSLLGNIVMCFLMGAAAGGLLPVVYALLAEIMPARHRGWALVLVGGVGGVGGYLAASGFSALLQPEFGWRILWFLNLPTGLVLVAMSGLIPESAKFLMSIGRTAAAQEVLRRFGSVVAERASPPGPRAVASPAAPAGRDRGLTAGLSLAALAWSLINFGLLLWLPADLVAKGYSVHASSALLAKSALIALPTVGVAALVYSRWSTKGSLAGAIGLSILGVLSVLVMEAAPEGAVNPVLTLALLLVGSNALLAILLPYAAESYAVQVRGRATGWVAGCSKFGGLITQLLGILAAVPALWIAALIITVPAALAMALIGVFGVETRGRALPDEAPEAAPQRRAG